MVTLALKQTYKSSEEAVEEERERKINRLNMPHAMDKNEVGR